MRNAFVNMGRAETAVWGEFVRRVEGRASGLPDHQNANMPSVTTLPASDSGGVVPVVSAGTMSVPVNVQVERSQDPMGSIGRDELGNVIGMKEGMVNAAVGAHHRTGLAQKSEVFDDYDCSHY